MPIQIDTVMRPIAAGRSAAVVRVVGELDASSADEAQRALAVLLAGTTRVVILDLEGLRFVDSRGLTVLLWTRLEMKKRGGSVLMTNVQHPIRRVFEIVRALPDVPIFETRAELDAYLKAEQDAARGGGS